MEEQVEDLESVSVLLSKSIISGEKEKTTELINLVDGLLDKFDGRQGGRGLYRDQKGAFFQVEMYTNEDWEWWQIIASFARIKFSLSDRRCNSILKDKEKEKSSEIKEEITKLIAKMRGEL